VCYEDDCCSLSAEEAIVAEQHLSNVNLGLRIESTQYIVKNDNLRSRIYGSSKCLPNQCQSIVFRLGRQPCSRTTLCRCPPERVAPRLPTAFKSPPFSCSISSSRPQAWMTVLYQFSSISTSSVRPHTIVLMLAFMSQGF